jgi:hypothetical protein
VSTQCIVNYCNNLATRHPHEGVGPAEFARLFGERGAAIQWVGLTESCAFDPAIGALETVVLGDREEPAASLSDAGSFAAIVRAHAD